MTSVWDYFRPASALALGTIMIGVGVFMAYVMISEYGNSAGALFGAVMGLFLFAIGSIGFMLVLGGIALFIESLRYEEDDWVPIEEGDDQT